MQEGLFKIRDVLSIRLPLKAQWLEQILDDSRFTVACRYTKTFLAENDLEVRETHYASGAKL
jgi:hypothetical protein